MKTLYLIRHAKSSWSDPTLSDFQRPLNKRGKRDAPFMGRRLREAGILPDLIISSAAKRAAKTAGIIAREIGYDKKDIDFRDEVYSSDILQLLAIIRSTRAGIDSLCLVGHNYVITDLAEWLSGTSLVNIPTCGIVALSFAGGTWEAIGEDAGQLLFFDYPKLHTTRSDPA
jgi:phosphohistidine phosphatase